MEPASDLQSKEHGNILDVIDELRSLGISHHIDLPQIIVCGDQSSGKSSVLEALSGLRFPRKDNLCTRFAIEVVLRRGVAENVDISIVPNPTAVHDGGGDVVDFHKEHVDINDMELLIDEATKVLGIDGNSKKFSNDILRFEVTGPRQLQLTLVDLPGLFQAGNKAQSDEDMRAVTELVLSYMKKTRSIILAVVSAKNDFANQIVTKYTRELDRYGYRTLGVITKPDTLHVGSESEIAFLELAENKDVHLHHGWHVLKNRDFDTRTASANERDEAEQEFFAKGIWMNLPRNQVGISSFRPRLSVLLRNQILEELPSLIVDIQAGVDESQKTLVRLGASRANLQEQRLYLLRASQSFSSLMKSAVDGSYNDVFFGNPSTEEGASKRLRAVIQNIFVDFSSTMRQNGHARHIMEHVTEQQQKANPRLISRNGMIDEVIILMKQSRGRELPGTYNPQIVGDLFQAQSQPWEQLMHSCVERIWDTIKTALDLILAGSTDENTIKGLKHLVVDPMLAKIRDESERMILTVLEPHTRGHPITYNHYLTDNIQKLRRTRDEKALMQNLDQFFGTKIKKGKTEVENVTFDAQALLKALLSHATNVDMDRYACSEAIDVMKAYYKVAIKTFVDTFSTLVVESQLLQKLPSLLTPENILLLDDDTVQTIAAEPEEMTSERSQTEAKLESLRRALHLLQTLERSKQRAPHPKVVTSLEDVQLGDMEDDRGAEESEEEQASPRESPFNETFEEQIEAPAPAMHEPVFDPVAMRASEVSGIVSKKAKKKSRNYDEL